MNKLKFAFTVFFLFMFASVLSAEDRQWPDDPKRISGAFGGFRDFRFSEGLAFLSEGQRANAWSDGEVIWTTDGESRIGSVPDQPFVAIRHDDGFRSVYKGIDPRPDLDRQVSAGEWLGYAEGNEWMFSILDVERSRIVDPLSMLPSRVGLSRLTIGRVELVRAGSRTSLAEGMTIKSGRWTLSIEIPFSLGDALRNELSLYWVGELLGRIRFVSLSESPNGVLLEVPEERTLETMYDDQGRILFPDLMLNAGRGTLELRVSDELGRVTTQNWNIVVQ